MITNNHIMGFFTNFLISIDQLGNVIAGGNPDNTISSRIGYYTQHFKNSGWQWILLGKIINTTFWPLDGPNHCHEAYHNDAGEEFDKGTNNILVAIIAALLIIPSCIITCMVLYTLYFLKIISPKKINRNKNIKKRLHLVQAKLEGTYHEITEHPVIIDQKLIEEADKTIACVKKVVMEIKSINKNQNT